MDSAQANPRHSVQFYGSDQSLFATVGGFLSEGLIEVEPAILIATDSHVAGIFSELERRLIDVDRARRTGDLIVLDAHELLEMLFVNDVPRAALFDQHMGLVIGQALAGRHSRVRIYGEIVDILWKGGRAEAALALELLWNKLVAHHGCALLCGYSMGHFYKRSEQMQQICEQHTHVLPSDSRIVPFNPTRARTA